jgi:cobalt-zinc-cadmium resistance protein CzcA
MPIDASDMMIILKDKGMDFCQNFWWIIRKNGKELEAVRCSYGFQYPVQMRFNELMTAQGKM